MPNPNSLFRRLGLCETLSRTFGLYSQNISLFIPLGAILVVPLTLVLCFTIDDVAEMVSEFSIEEDFDVNAWMVKNASSFFTFWSLLVIASVFFGLPAQAAIMRATALIYAGESSPSLLECAKEGFRKLCSVFCFKFSLQALIFAISICLGIVSGIVTVVIIAIFGEGAGTGAQILAQLASMTITYYIMIAMLVAVPSIVVERKTWCKDAMDRSWELTEQKRCFLFAALLVYGFVLMPILLVYYGVMFAILGPSGVFSAKGALAYSFLCLVTLPIAHM